MPLSAELCVSEWGWPSIYYIHGVISLILFCIFMVYHRNSPTKHPLMKRRELVKVMFGKGSIYSGPNKRKVSKKVPHSAIFRGKLNVGNSLKVHCRSCDMGGFGCSIRQFHGDTTLPSIHAHLYQQGSFLADRTNRNGISDIPGSHVRD